VAGIEETLSLASSLAKREFSGELRNKFDKLSAGHLWL
jgi:hypothetical protein